MSDLTWEQVSLLNVETLEDAAAYWGTYIEGIQESAEAVENDVPAIISEENFGEEVGENARDQVRNVATELGQHVEEAATKIKTILEDAFEALSQCKDDMRDVIDDVLAAKLVIDDSNKVQLTDARIADIEAKVRRENPDVDPITALVLDEGERVMTNEADPLTERLEEILEAAREHDDDFTQRLNAIRDSHVDMPPPLGSDWHEDVAQYWAGQAVDLLNGGEDGEMSPAELDEFNGLLEDYGHIPEFATTLMEDLGPEGTMTHVMDIVNDVYGTDPSGDLTAEQIDAMYEGLGNTLATATNPDNEPHVDEQWVTDLMNLGAGEVTTSDGNWTANGYELLAPALPHGTYHEDFIVPVTEHIMALDSAQNWSEGPPLSGAGHMDPPYGSNPLNYALEAIDHNPEAAIDLFGPNSNGLDNFDGIDMGIHDAEVPEDPFEYLMDRATDFGSYRDMVDPNVLGGALESAATGISTDPAYATDDPPQHTNHMADLTDRLVDYATDNPDKFTGGSLSPMVDNLGGITAAYIDDFQRAFADGGNEEWTINQPGIDLDLSSGGRENQELAVDWLKIIGHDEMASAEVWGASEALMYSQLEAAAQHNPDGQSGIYYNNAFEMHGGMTSAMTAGTFDAIANDQVQLAEDKNAVWDVAAEGAKYGLGAGAGYLTGNPWAAAGFSQGAGYFVDPIFDNFRMTEDEVQAEIDRLQEDQSYQSEGMMNTPETLENIDAILQEDPNLDEADREQLLQDYYRRHWDGVRNLL